MLFFDIRFNGKTYRLALTSIGSVEELRELVREYSLHPVPTSLYPSIKEYITRDVLEQGGLNHYQIVRFMDEVRDNPRVCLGNPPYGFVFLVEIL